MSSTDIETILSRYPDVSFIGSRTLESIRAEMITDYRAKYKELTGNDITIGDADPAKLALDACALQIYQMCQYIDAAAKNGLLKYARGGYLDNLAALRGISRSEATPAVTTLRFTLSAARTGAVGIPAGTRCTNAGLMYFQTDEYAEISAGNTYVDVQATCTEPGTAGNGIAAGDISTIVDPIAYVESVENTTETSGGTDTETDDSLAERAYLAPGKYSTAGPTLAYEYWVRNYQPDATDVQVTSPSLGKIRIRYLTSSGVPTTDMCSKLQEELSDKTIRPITDHVVVEPPEVTDVELAITYYIAESDTSSVGTIQQQVAAAISSYKAWQAGKIGRDINPDALIQRVLAAGAKRCVVTSPVYTTVEDSDVAIVSKETVTYGGLEDD